MQAGQLRHRVTVQEPGDTHSAGGGREQSWVDVATVWGAVRPATAREIDVGEKTNMQLTHMVEVRWQDNVFLPERRFKFGARYLEIIGARNPAERGINALISCVEVEL